MIGVPNIDPCRAHTYMKLMKEGTRTQTTRSFYLCPLDLKRKALIAFQGALIAGQFHEIPLIANQTKLPPGM